MKMDRRERKRFTGLLDMIDGGGAGRAGNEFEGGLLSEVLNALGIRPRGFEERQERMASVTPMPRRPAMPAADTRYQPQPAAAPMSTQPGYFSPAGPQALPTVGAPNRDFGIVPTQSSIERYMTEYGITPEQLGAPTMSDAPMLPQPDMARGPLVGYLPQAGMPNDPRITLEMLQSLPIDPITGLPLAMTPPRLPY
jgi:hypothetical protein